MSNVSIKDKINFNGYYYMSHENRVKYYGKNSYSTWCKNHTFKPTEYNGKVIMVDTYWGGFNENLKIEVTEDNFDLFELQVDTTKVKAIKENEREQYGYDNVISVITGGMGSSRITYYVSNELDKNVAYTIAQIDEKIDSLNRQLQNCLDLKREIAETGIVPKYLSF